MMSARRSKASRNPLIPIIILTAADNEEDEQNALRAGADGFFPKMRGWQPLIERVKIILDVGDFGR